MKTALVLTLAGILLISTTRLHAQDWKKTNPQVNAVVLDTTLVRAMVVTIGPGKKSEAHTHPANFFYALTDGKLVVHYTDGKDETYDLKAGDAGFGDPERPHVTENVGSKEVKFLLVELKEHPYKAPMMKK
ncbi:MAG: cupin domain-containing protein [Ignavibacteriales bacterium]|nr:cupin domain-containing protein [Ignavibacteriales bacterium]